MQELLENLTALVIAIRKDRVGLREEDKRQELQRLEKAMQDPLYWRNAEDAAIIGKKARRYREALDFWQSLEDDAAQLVALAKSSVQEDNDSLFEEIVKQYDEVKDRYAHAQRELYFSGPYDEDNAIVSFSAGAGGVDAADWTEMLLRMYLRYAEKKEWSASVVVMSRGQEAGIKSATVRIVGDRAYGHLKTEAGVHRLVRQSPFNADKLRQTSFALVEVLPEFEQIHDIIIPEEELRIDVFRSGGRGGQSVNTTDSAVRIVHLPTNITVSCQNERSQLQNKATAMRILKAKLYQRQLDDRQRQKDSFKGSRESAEWGSQIRSYVLHPYQMVKDHRTNHETAATETVLDGDLDPFVYAYLQANK